MLGRLAVGMSTATKSTPLIHQVGDEGDVARQAIKASDQQHRPALAPFRKGGVELGLFRVAASALNLGELGGKCLAGGKETPDARALGVETKAAHSLPVSRRRFGPMHLIRTLHQRNVQ
jgi:hypothetical protein